MKRMFVVPALLLAMSVSWLLLDVSSEADELPTDVDAALEADDVLSAIAGGAVRVSASVAMTVVAVDVVVKRGACMVLA